MQACDHRSIEGLLLFTPNINVLRSQHLRVKSELLCPLRCAPLLCRVEVQALWLDMDRDCALQTLQALRSLPQSITWQPLNLIMCKPQAQSVVQEVCAALIGTPLVQDVSKLTLGCWEVEPPIAALRASFPNVLHFELCNCTLGMTSSLCETIAVWPMLQSINFLIITELLVEAQQQLEAAASSAAELKAGQPFEIALRVHVLREGDAGILDAQVAAIRSACGGKVAVRWESTRVQ